VLIAGSTNLPVISQFMASQVTPEVSLALALFGFIMVAIAENARIPVDNPATHLELTMVHEAMVLEYSGRHLALIEWAASVKLLLFLSLLAAIFAPWGIAPFGAGPVFITGALIAYLAKLALGAALLGFFEVSIAKMRVFRVPEFLGAALMLGLLATLLRMVVRSL
jgi:formate hydrogenlyase subunit 4